MTPRELYDRWQSALENLRQYGDPRSAEVLERCAAELRESLEETETAPVTLAQAVQLSDYSGSQLRRLVAKGELQNVGQNGELLFRRGDLPRKPAGKRAEIRKARGVEAVQRLRRVS